MSKTVGQQIADAHSNICGYAFARVRPGPTLAEAIDAAMAAERARALREAEDLAFDLSGGGSDDTGPAIVNAIRALAASPDAGEGG